MIQNASDLASRSIGSETELPASAGLTRFGHGWEVAFLVSVVVLLGITGMAKLGSLLHLNTIPVLHQNNPIFGLKNWLVMAAAGSLELTAVSLLLMRISLRDKFYLVFWLGMVLLLYRWGLHFVGFRGYCGCLGTVTNYLPIPPGILEGGLFATVVYMIGGSLLFIAFDSPQVRKAWLIRI